MKNLEKEKIESANTLTFIVDERTYVSRKQNPNGSEIKTASGNPLDVKLYLQNSRPWIDNLIKNDEEVDLARPGIEYFFTEKKFEINVNGKIFTWHQRYITGEQVRKLAGLDKDDQLFLKTSHSSIDQLIANDDKVDLQEPGIEQFYSKQDDKQITIIVSGVQKQWDKKKISFKEVVILAYGQYEDRPTMVYTVAYEDGPKQNPEGSMIKGSEVVTKNMMIFHATATDKS
jgi:hypothetical protein